MDFEEDGRKGKNPSHIVNGRNLDDSIRDQAVQDENRV